MPGFFIDLKQVHPVSDIPSHPVRSSPVGDIFQVDTTKSGRNGTGYVDNFIGIGGINFDVWVGPRGGSGSNSNAPVVSYVAIPTQQSMSFDLMNFIDDAEQNGISQSWYLTDVFGGFEIWTGSSGVGLSLDTFSVEIN